MRKRYWEQLDAATGLASLLIGMAGGALERGWPNPGDPFAVRGFVAEHRAAILWQSMLFVLSGAVYLWFLGSVRSVLARAEGGTAGDSTIMFGAGVTWVALSMVAQAFQIGVVMAPSHAIEPAFLFTMNAAFGIANLPLGVMLVAFAVSSFRTRAFPRWLAWTALATAGAQLVLWAGAVISTGPFAPNGALAYVLYPAFAIWLVSTTILMMKRAAASVSPTQDYRHPGMAGHSLTEHTRPMR